MRTVVDLRAWAQRQWRRHWPNWLAARSSEPWDSVGCRMSLGLQPPTQQQLANDPDAVASWVRDWRELERDSKVEIEWVARRWSAFGTQRLPARATAGPGTIAALAGQSSLWQRACAAADALAAAWPETDFAEFLASAGRQLGALQDEDVVRLLAVAAWLIAHPASGLWERELPVAEVDTKWLERHRSLVEPLVGAVTGSPQLGLRRTATRFRVRLLDAALAGGPRDFSVDLGELCALAVRPERVIICENLTSVAVLPELASTVAVHGMGFAAPTLAEVPWLAAADVRYWGDLDSWGFLILGRVRSVLPNTTSLLMDATTWASFEHLAVVEPRPFTGEIGYLGADELEQLAQIRSLGLRLEQERLQRDYVQQRLLALDPK